MIVRAKLARLSTSLRIKDRAECGKGSELQGGPSTDKMYTRRQDTAHTFLMGGTIGVGTPHNIDRKSLAVGGWVVQTRK